MTKTDAARLEALVKSAFAADERESISVSVRDLRWLLCFVDSLCQSAGDASKDRLEVPRGDHE